jgi:hypothetical protein
MEKHIFSRRLDRSAQSGVIPMTRPRARDSWQDDVDLDRLAAQPGCVAAAWILVALILVMAVVGPAAAALIERTAATIL